MLVKIAIENFKSIGKRIELEVKPLTILIGPNASGKSNILEALSLLVQSIGRSGYDYRGESYPHLISYSKLEDIAYNGSLKNSISIEVHIKPNENEMKILSELAEEINNRNLGFLIDNKITSVGYRYSYNGESYSGEQEIFCDEKEIIRVITEKTDSGVFRHVFAFPSILKGERIEDNSTIILQPSVFKLHPSAPPTLIDRVKPLNDFAMRVVNMITSKFILRGKSKVYFISAQRSKIDYEISTEKFYEWVGKRGEHLLPILAQLTSPRYKQKGNKVREWALEFGIKDPWANWSGPNRASGEFIDTELGTPLNLALASYGSSQILVIIAQLFLSEEGDIILIEEPEISIHPEGQAKLPELFADAIKEGKQIIITTHSIFIPLALSRALKEGLKVEDIAVYEVTKDKEGTKVERKEINEQGYIKGWIKSFYKTEENLIMEWAKAISKMEHEGQ
jgi:AAA15 family ATPase/GTPase